MQLCRNVPLCRLPEDRQLGAGVGLPRFGGLAELLGHGSQPRQTIILILRPPSSDRLG